MVIEVSSEQFEKAELPIEVTLLGIVTERIVFNPQKT